MIETSAVVVKTEKNQVWVKSSQTLSCGQCSLQRQCSTRVLDAVSQTPIFAIVTELELKIGDEVQIAIAENRLLGAAMMMYLMPLCALFVGAGVAETLLIGYFSNAELTISCFALLSFLSSLKLIKPLQQRFLNSPHCQAVLVKKLLY